MYRKISDDLHNWKNSAYRKPLILQGARQVGKTYSILEFAKNNYDNVAYVNFEYDENAKKLFESGFDPAKLIARLQVFTRQTITKARTLLFFDEVQQCPPALTSLKYFSEFAPDYHVVAAGSLLGVAVSIERHSFPVGKIDRLTMYPMDFEEFLLATSNMDTESAYADMIKKCFNDNSPMDPIYHERLIELYRLYLLIGGMPECVMKYTATKNPDLIRVTQNTILNDYLDDMSKYNSNGEIKKTRLTYNSITVQLSKPNTRFQYKLIKSGGRAAEF